MPTATIETKSRAAVISEKKKNEKKEDLVRFVCPTSPEPH
jgi:hypothetical protein